MRGLKFVQIGIVLFKQRVAPFTGAWIEIIAPFWVSKMVSVAPFTGAWIEMTVMEI